MDRGAWWAIVHRATKESDMTKRTEREREIRGGMVGRIRGGKTKERAVNKKTGREAAAVSRGLLRSVHDTFQAISLHSQRKG